MNKYKSIVDPSSLVMGDIVQIPTTASVFTRRDRTRGVEGAKATFTYGYVTSKPLYETQAGDRATIEIYEILPHEHADRLDKNYVTVNQDDAGNALGLHQDRKWAIVLDPIKIDATPVNLRRDGLIQRVGNISDTVLESKIHEQIHNLGNRLKLGPEDGPGGFQKPNVETWGLFARGLGRKNFKDDEFVPVEKRTYKKRRDTFTGKVLDMDLADAVKALKLPEEIALIFGKAHGRKNPAITSLRMLWTMAEKDPSAMDAYVPEPSALKDTLLLKDTDLHPGIINGLAEPKAGTGLKPVRTLKSAYNLVKHPDASKILEGYMYMGPKTRQYAMEDIPELYESLPVETSKEEKTSIFAKAIKSAWRILAHDYAISHETKQIPDKYINEDGTPVWKLVPIKP